MREMVLSNDCLVVGLGRLRIIGGGEDASSYTATVEFYKTCLYVFRFLYDRIERVAVLILFLYLRLSLAHGVLKVPDARYRRSRVRTKYLNSNIGSNNAKHRTNCWHCIMASTK